MRMDAIALGTMLLLATSPARALDDAKAAVEARLKPLLDQFFATVDALPGYCVTMTKQQRIDGELRPQETLLMKHRRSPECRYLKWIDEPHRNREVILCADRDDDRIHVHQPGMLGFTLSLSPDSWIVTSGNLRPVSQSGLFNMARLLRSEVAHRTDGSRPVPLPQLSDREIYGETSLCLNRDQDLADDPAPYKVGAGELCFDKTSAMPTRMQFWDTGGQLMERYTFRDYRLDAGLKDRDFDIRNPDYHF